MTRLIFLLLALAPMTGSALDLILPTPNRALFAGDGPAFYQYTDRTFEGRKSTPWEGGTYGFTRTPVRTAAGVLNRQFHEGVDIKPVTRAANGDPTDPVLAIAAGRVVHVSTAPGYSNYGRYVVVEHEWDGCPYYSLYAHLASTAVEPGARVLQGARLGQMGYSGRGIDQTRAHVHFEICLLLNRSFEKWHSAFFPGDPNRHGIYNGLNLSGLDVAALYLALRKDPALTIPRFLADQEEVFRVIVPAQPLDLLRLYPWLKTGDRAGAAWEISFAGSGLPLRIAAADRAVAKPTVSWTKSSPFPVQYFTKGYVTGPAARLTESGERLIALLLQP